MTAVVYDADTLQVFQQYATLSGAKAARTRKWYPRLLARTVAVDTMEDFMALDYEIEVINCITNKPAKIMKSQQGGCCDPSTERYHCM